MFTKQLVFQDVEYEVVLVDNAVNMDLHYVLQHPDCLETYVRIRFVDFILTFNTIILGILTAQLSADGASCHVSVDYQLFDRQNTASEAKRYFLHSDSQYLYSENCYLCVSSDPSVKILKYSFDTIGSHPVIRMNLQGEVDHLVHWCNWNNLENNGF